MVQIHAIKFEKVGWCPVGKTTDRFDSEVRLRQNMVLLSLNRGVRVPNTFSYEGL